MLLYKVRRGKVIILLNGRQRVVYGYFPVTEVGLNYYFSANRPAGRSTATSALLLSHILGKFHGGSPN